MRAEGKTQAEVAAILGTTQTNISKIERKMKGK
jgi:transcriptional regulator